MVQNEAKRWIPVAATIVHDIDPDATLTAVMLAYLKNCMTGTSGKGGPRYQQHDLGVKHSFGGYKVDDWFRATSHFLYFHNRRNGKLDLTGDQGPKGTPAQIAWIFRDEDSPGLLSADKHYVVPSNVMSTHAIRMTTLITEGRGVEPQNRSGPQCIGEQQVDGATNSKRAVLCLLQ